MLARTIDLPLLGNIFNDEVNGGFSHWAGKEGRKPDANLPKVNIKEGDKGFTLDLSAPGLTKADFSINCDNDLLTISSEVQEFELNENERFTRKEFTRHAFTRTFTLPETVDGEKIHAKYHGGILSVSIPKKEEAKPRPPRRIVIE